MSKDALLGKKCKPCEGTESPLAKSEIGEYLSDLKDWALTKEETLLFREVTTENFMQAVDLINKIAGVAEEEGHHPDLHLTGYKHLRVELSTHAIGGLSENDFIMAAKINEILI